MKLLFAVLEGKVSRIVTVARCYSRGKGDAPTPSPVQFRAVLLVLEVGVVLCSASLRPQQLLAHLKSGVVPRGTSPFPGCFCHHTAPSRVPNRCVCVNFPLSERL